MTCKELVELVTDYLEGALSPQERTRFEQHISRCESCTIYLEQLRQTIRLVGELREELISPEAARELLSVFRNWKHG